MWTLYDNHDSGNGYKVRLALSQLDLAPYPALRAWLDRVSKQPGYIPMLADEIADHA